MQIIIVIAAVIFGLLYNYNFTGFAFIPAICLFAGLFLVMPTLFSFKLHDFGMLKQYKALLLKSLFANFILLPIIAIGIGLLFADFGMAAGLFLLSVLAGGGMVMRWVHHSGADAKLGFITLSINLFLLFVSIFMFQQFGIHLPAYFDMPAVVSEISMHQFVGPMMTLVIIPFLVSRVLLKFQPNIVAFITNHSKHISNTAIFIIIFYLFALENTKVLFQIEVIYFFKSLAMVVSFYTLTLILGKLLFNLDNVSERSIFWYLINRYITLALIIATFSIDIFGATMILPIMMAYFIQIPLSIYLVNILKK